MTDAEENEDESGAGVWDVGRRSRRDRASVFRSARATCCSTVRGDRCSTTAISRFIRPRAAGSAHLTLPGGEPVVDGGAARPADLRGLVREAARRTRSTPQARSRCRKTARPGGQETAGAPSGRPPVPHSSGR
ncbi:hypothetical protein SVIOM342S_09334 [Streptomyces violaceorubidus]